MRQSKLLSAFLMGMLCLGFFHQADAVAKAKGKEKTLYQRLGGQKAIKAVVDEFVGNCAGDARINSFFAATASDKARLGRFKSNLVNQICQASGGPCKYTGKTMKEAHNGMGTRCRCHRSVGRCPS